MTIGTCVRHRCNKWTCLSEGVYSIHIDITYYTNIIRYFVTENCVVVVVTLFKQSLKHYLSAYAYMLHWSLIVKFKRDLIIMWEKLAKKHLYIVIIYIYNNIWIMYIFVYTYIVIIRVEGQKNRSLLSCLMIA